FRYSRASAQTPVWVTAQALAAVRRKPLPLHPAARTKPAAKRAAAKDRARRGPAPARAQSRAQRDRAPSWAHAASSARPRTPAVARVSARTASVGLPRHHASPWWRTPVTAGAAAAALALLAGTWLARGRHVRSR